MDAKQVIRMFDDAKWIARHGDVILVQDDSAPLAAVDAKGIVAEGEVTGHAHRVHTLSKRAKARVLHQVDDLIHRTVEIRSAGTVIDHEEHKAIELPLGRVRTGIQLQYNPLGWGRVVD